MDRETRSHPAAAFHLPLERGRRNQHILHAKWSADPAIGFLEYWINGVKMVGDANGPFRCATMYEGCTNYLVAGIYRRLSIGDPNLIWPMDAAPGVDYPHGFVPGKGARVYQKDDGYPGVMPLGAVTLATSRDDLPPFDDLPPPAPVDPVKARAGLQILIDEKQRLLDAVAQLTSCIAQLEGLPALARDLTAVREGLTKRIDVIGKLLDRGPW
jgi:hypothetical protein